MLDVILLVIRLLLTTIFAIAGIGKLTDPASSKQSLQDFGVPPIFINLLSVFLPFAELTIAVALVPKVSAWWAAVAAFVLLVVFTIAIGLNLAHGHKPDCNCFGQFHSTPIGWWTILRNGLLIAVTGVLILQGHNNSGLSITDWLFELEPLQINIVAGIVTILFILIIQGWLLIQLLRQSGRLLLRVANLETRLAIPNSANLQPKDGFLRGLPIGTIAPPFSLKGLYGETITLEDLSSTGKPVLIIFISPNCGACVSLLPKVSKWQVSYRENLTIAIISSGDVTSIRDKSEKYGLTQVFIQEGKNVAKDYRSTLSPSAVVINPNGKVGSPLSEGSQAIESLVKRFS